VEVLDWFLRRSALILASCVLAGLAMGWYLPATRDAVFGLALAQIAMAVVVLINESTKLARERAK
jgi:hypothetical protein